VVAIVRLLVPFAAKVVGLNVGVAPDGSPLALNVTVELNPFTVVIVTT
jgi:hypothetical protein